MSGEFEVVFYDLTVADHTDQVWTLNFDTPDGKHYKNIVVTQHEDRENVQISWGISSCPPNVAVVYAKGLAIAVELGRLVKHAECGLTFLNHIISLIDGVGKVTIVDVESKYPIIH